MQKKIEGAIKRRKTTHNLPVDILDRLRVYAAAVQKDQQDIIADLLDKHLPQNPFKKANGSSLEVA
jgi:hypothetical protein